MFFETFAQCVGCSASSRIACEHHDVYGRKRVLIQAERFSRKSFDAIASNSAAKSAGGYGQTQTRGGCIVYKDRDAEIRIGIFFTALPNCAELGWLMQSLTRLEREATDR